MKVISKWFALYKQALSLGKSNFVLFHGNRKDPMKQITQLQVGSDMTTRTDKTQYIWVTLDEKLSWGPHIDEICNKLCKYLSVFCNIRNSVTAKTSRTIYYACIYPVLNFVFKCVKDIPIEPFKNILHSDMNIMTIICEIMKTLRLTRYYKIWVRTRLILKEHRYGMIYQMT